MIVYKWCSFSAYCLNLWYLKNKTSASIYFLKSPIIFKALVWLNVLSLTQLWFCQVKQEKHDFAESLFPGGKYQDEYFLFPFSHPLYLKLSCSFDFPVAFPLSPNDRMHPFGTSVVSRTEASEAVDFLLSPQSELGQPFKHLFLFPCTSGPNGKATAEAHPERGCWFSLLVLGATHENVSSARVRFSGFINWMNFRGSLA